MFIFRAITALPSGTLASAASTVETVTLRQLLTGFTLIGDFFVHKTPERRNKIDIV